MQSAIDVKMSGCFSTLFAWNNIMRKQFGSRLFHLIHDKNVHILVSPLCGV